MSMPSRNLSTGSTIDSRSLLESPPLPKPRDSPSVCRRPFEMPSLCAEQA
jgi:hypothetical protein